ARATVGGGRRADVVAEDPDAVPVRAHPITRPDRKREEAADGHVDAEDLVCGVIVGVRRLEEDGDPLAPEHRRGSAARGLGLRGRTRDTSRPDLHPAVEHGEDLPTIYRSITRTRRQERIIIHAPGEYQHAGYGNSD